MIKADQIDLKSLATKQNLTKDDFVKILEKNGLKDISGIKIKKISAVNCTLNEKSEKNFRNIGLKMMVPRRKFAITDSDDFISSHNFKINISLPKGPNEDQEIKDAFNLNVNQNNPKKKPPQRTPYNKHNYHCPSNYCCYKNHYLLPSKTQ